MFEHRLGRADHRRRRAFESAALDASGIEVRLARLVRIAQIYSFREDLVTTSGISADPPVRAVGTIAEFLNRAKPAVTRSGDMVTTSA